MKRMKEEYDLWGVVWRVEQSLPCWTNWNPHLCHILSLKILSTNIWFSHSIGYGVKNDIWGFGQHLHVIVYLWESNFSEYSVISSYAQSEPIRITSAVLTNRVFLRLLEVEAPELGLPGLVVSGPLSILLHSRGVCVLARWERNGKFLFSLVKLYEKYDITIFVWFYIDVQQPILKQKTFCEGFEHNFLKGYIHAMVK